MENLKRVITEIRPGRKLNSNRANIYLNGRYAFSLDNEVISRESLKTGLEISEELEAILTKSDALQKCYNASLRFLSYRPRSESEIRTKLTGKGYSQEDVNNTIERLKSLNLLNDNQFAEFWKENRDNFKPVSRQMLKKELRLKGVDKQIIDSSISGVDDEENAYRAAMSRAARIKTEDYDLFYRRIGGYLQRRGFGYGVVRRTVSRVWQEKCENDENENNLIEDNLETD
jgi:regulatory protein